MSPSARRTPPVLLASAMLLLTVLVILVLGELIVRLGVPAERLEVVSNVYSPPWNPGEPYRLRPRFAGTAFGVDLDTNAFGFRGPEWSVEKPDHTVRIAFVGDSIAFGYGVPFSRTFPQVVEASLNADGPRVYESLNFGVPGYNTIQQAAVFRRIALPFDPDILVVTVTRNDHNAPLFVDAEGWLRLERPGRALRIEDKSADLLKWSWKGPLGHSRLARYLTWTWARWLLREGAQGRRDAGASVPATWHHQPLDRLPPDRLPRRVLAPLREILATARREDVEVILYLNSWADAYRDMLRELAEAEGLPLLEQAELFPELEGYGQFVERFGLGWDSHPNAAAHERVGRALQRLIRERDLGGGRAP